LSATQQESMQSFDWAIQELGHLPFDGFHTVLPLGRGSKSGPTLMRDARHEPSRLFFILLDAPQAK
jgi:hypothetical protein